MSQLPVATRLARLPSASGGLHGPAASLGGRMRTLIVSDLHLGSLTRTDVLRRRELREPLLAELEDVDRVVLLGDVLELRHGPVRDALASSREFFEELGAAMAQGEIVITAGNHDHALVEPWLSARGQELEPPPLGPEQLLEPGGRLAGARADRRMERPGEGHGRLPRPVGAPRRVRHPRPLPGLPPHDPHARAPDDGRHGAGPGQAALEPAGRGRLRVDLRPDVRLARRRRPRRAHRGRAERHRHRHRLAGAARRDDGRRRLAGRRAGSAQLRRARPRSRPPAAHPRAGGGLPAGRGGAQPGRPRPPAQRHLRRGAAPGGPAGDGAGGRPPRPRAAPTSCSGTPTAPGPCRGTPEGEWRSPGGARLLNAGSWVYVSVFVSDAPAENPYWPGGCVVVDDEGPPQVRRLLQGFTRAQIAPPRRRPAGAPRSPRRRRDRGPASEPAVASVPAPWARSASRCCRPSPAGSGG